VLPRGPERDSARWLIAAVLATICAGCGPEPNPEPAPQPLAPLPAAIAADTSETAAVDSTGIPTSAALEGFPTVSGLSPRDFQYEETTGALKGYVTRFYRIKHVVGTTLIAILNNWKSPQGRIVDVPLHNMLIITELKDVMPTIERVLDQVDRLPAQVEIEAKVIEIRRSQGYEFGFELHVDRAPASNTAFRKFDGVFNSNSFLDSLRPGALPFQGASMNWAAVGKAQEILGDFEYVIRALETDGYAEVLSAPRVVVHSGHKAILTAKTKEPIIVTNIVNTTLQQISTTFEPVGVQLEVTPVVVGTEAILLDVKPSVSSVVSFIENPTGGIPIPRIAERTADTEVDVRNGELLVIGGLYEKTQTKDSTKIPIIGHVPLIGKLFSSINDAEERTDVIFILKLRILSQLERADERLRQIPGAGAIGEGK
jgi:type II secretory pathway component GspD/PulD (secretin)